MELSSPLPVVYRLHTKRRLTHITEVSLESFDELFREVGVAP